MTVQLEYTKNIRKTNKMITIKNTNLILKLLVKSLLIFACLNTTLFAADNSEKLKRWYTAKQVILGKEVFAKNCASCHGYKAEKTIVWKKTLSDGSYPPPPLNDKAHAWHHPYSQMLRIIKNGGKSYDGKMPAFIDVLSDKEIDETIAYFQSFWSDEFYGYWSEREKK